LNEEPVLVSRFLITGFPMYLTDDPPDTSAEMLLDTFTFTFPTPLTSRSISATRNLSASSSEAPDTSIVAVTEDPINLAFAAPEIEISAFAVLPVYYIFTAPLALMVKSWMS